MTLSAVASFTQKFIIFFVLAVILGIASFIGYKAWYANYLAHLPPVEEKPEIKWGVLPSPDFPASGIFTNNFSYTIDTQSGLLALEKFGTVAKVYFIPKGVTTFLSSQRALDLALKFGISGQPEILSETKHRFKKDDKTIVIDVDTSNFNYIKDATSAAKLAAKLSGDSNLIVRDFKNFLANKNLMKDELRDGPVKLQYLKFIGSQLAPSDANEAQAAQISIWPKDINNKQIVTPNTNKALVSAIFTKSASELENYINLEYIYWPVDIEISSTYPIKSAEAAFNELKGGKGIIILAPDKTQVSITSIKLAYFEGDKYSSYLEPVFVFEGPSFISYIPAITEQYLQAK